MFMNDDYLIRLHQVSTKAYKTSPAGASKQVVQGIRTQDSHHASCTDPSCILSKFIDLKLIVS